MNEGFKNCAKPVEKVIKRNTEEHMNWALNLCFCFFCQYICRVKPVLDDDIYVIDSRSECEKCCKKAEDVFIPRCIEYQHKLDEYNMLKGSDSIVKLPEKPSLFRVIICTMSNFEIIIAIFYYLCHTAFHTIQPAMMDIVLSVLDERQDNPDVAFPFAAAIILILSPLFHTLFDVSGIRLLFHYSVRVRASLAGMIYNKTLLLNIATQSNTNPGEMLSLLATDSRNIAEFLPACFHFLLMPIQFVVTLVYALNTIGISTFVAVGTIVIFTPVIIFIVIVLSNATRRYLHHNDDRNKLINETIEGIRMVKYTGLEEVFINRISVPRGRQLKSVWTYTLAFLMLCAFLHNLPQFVYYATFLVLVAVRNIDKDDFAVHVMPGLGYLAQMCEPCEELPLFIQGTVVMMAGQRRIRDFLLLPQRIDTTLHNVSENGAGEDEGTETMQNAVLMNHVSFTHGTIFSIPRDMDACAEEMENQKKEKGKRRKTGKKRDAEKGEQEDNCTSTSSAVVPAGTSTSKDKEYKDKDADTNAGTGGWEGRLALKDVSLRIPQGSFTVVIGRCGSGKSTLGSAIIGDLECITSLSESSRAISPSLTYSARSYTYSCSSSSTILPPNTNPAFSPSSSESGAPNRSTPVEATEKRNQKGKEKENENDGTETNTSTCVGMEAKVEAKVEGEVEIGMGMEVNVSKGKQCCCVNGEIAYCPQEAWIISSTVRKNIIFDKKGSFDADLYQRALEVCALEKDIHSLVQGDMTAIGEKGINLSGGQKARIQLARAVYADRDIYVLDDPLSAVDARVEKIIFEECIMNHLIRDKKKTVIMMCNQLRYLQRVDHIIVMEGSVIAHQGSYDELVQRGVEFRKYVDVKAAGAEEMIIPSPASFAATTTTTTPPTAVDSTSSTHPLLVISRPTSAIPSVLSTYSSAPSITTTLALASSSGAGLNIFTEEELSTESIPLSTYTRYFLSLLPLQAMIPFIFVLLLLEACVIFGDYWLGVIGTPEDFPVFSYGVKLYLFGAFAVGGFLFMIFRAFVGAYAAIRANGTLHTNLLSRVMHSPTSFFDTTPIGRILNRFTGDMTQIDLQLLCVLLDVVSVWAQVVGQMVIIAIDTQWFMLVGIPTIGLFILLLVFYARISRNLQRIESISRSAVLSQFGETVTGRALSCIRVYGVEDVWRRRFHATNDRWNVRFLLFCEGKQWATLCSSVISTLFMVGVVSIGWVAMSPAKLGVAIAASMTFGHLGSSVVEKNVDVESRMTSTERVHFYSNKLPQEKACLTINSTGCSIPASESASVSSSAVSIAWPTSGTLSFENVSFRYRPGLPFVLRNINLTIQSGEKIGICGRTGAGKTSLTVPLFRIVELNPSLQPYLLDPKTGFPIEVQYVDEGERETLQEEEVANCKTAGTKSSKVICEVPNKGRILIDGVDIASVELPRLRKALAIIPQNPTLFSGTVRYNMDIGGEHTDADILRMLQVVELESPLRLIVASRMEMEKNRDGHDGCGDPDILNMELIEGGRNLSAGQKQLLCIGRAILNNCRIVILDEATAAVDEVTDNQIQRTIRSQLHNCTLVVIAHRLSTILDSDRIVVISGGSIVEEGAPTKLLEDEHSHINQLLKSTEVRESEK